MSSTALTLGWSRTQGSEESTLTCERIAAGCKHPDNPQSLSPISKSRTLSDCSIVNRVGVKSGWDFSGSIVPLSQREDVRGAERLCEVFCATLHSSVKQACAACLTRFQICSMGIETCMSAVYAPNAPNSSIEFTSTRTGSRLPRPLVQFVGPGPASSVALSPINITVKAWGSVGFGSLRL